MLIFIVAQKRTANDNLSLKIKFCNYICKQCLLRIVYYLKCLPYLPFVLQARGIISTLKQKIHESQYSECLPKNSHFKLRIRLNYVIQIHKFRTNYKN